MLTYIFLSLGIIGLLGVLVLTFRKFPTLATIDINQIKEDQELKRKEEILIERLFRKWAELKNNIVQFLRPFLQRIKQIFDRFYFTLLEWEKKSNKQKMSETEIRNKIKALEEKSEILKKEGQVKEAERKLIEAISLNPKEESLYVQLAKLYLEEKEYQEAQEVYRHLLKINPHNEEYYLALSEIYEMTGNLSRALFYAKEAYQKMPNNPKILDHLIKISIIIGNEKLAKEVLAHLKKINPQNEKIDEFEKQIQEISKNKPM